MPFIESLAQFGHLWLMELVVLIILFVLLVMNWKRTVRFLTSNMIPVALTVWAVGVAVYVLGFSYEGTARSFPALILRSMQASLGMFISDNELIEVSLEYKESPAYMTVFAAVHAFALFLSAIFIFNTIGSRLKSSTSVLLESFRCRRQDRETYVFWGVNAPSVSLAKDVRKQYPDARIIFLYASGAGSMGEKLEVTQLIDTESVKNHRTSDVGLIDGIDSAMLVYVSQDAVSRNKYARLRRILESSSHLHFFFLTDDDSINMTMAGIIAVGHQFDFNDGQSVDIHVLSEHSAKRHALEEHLLFNPGRKGNVRLHFVDLAVLSVSSLKHYASQHPVSTYPAEDVKEGRVDGEFNAMVLGLGGTGREMFKFLYEFSSFVGPDGKPVKKHISLFEKDMDACLGAMFRSCPDVLSSGVVEPMDIEVGTYRFWELVREKADTLNCICVNMGDDELDLRLTRELYKHLLQYRGPKALRTRIYVRIYSSEYEEAIRSVAARYNASNIASGLEILPYGGVSALFNTKIIMATNIADAFRAFNYRYDVIRGKNLGCTAEECWNIDFDIDRYYRKYNDASVALDELLRREEQCHSETFHIGTIIRLAGIKDGDKERLRAFVDLTASRKTGDTQYDVNDNIAKGILDTLAQTAFLRQKASHELLGFKPAADADVRKDTVNAARCKLTPYVLDWADCPAMVRAVAYAVVDTSFSVAHEFVKAHERF